MKPDVPYMTSVKNLTSILDKIQNAAAPDAFGLDFLKDLGFTSSNDRGVIKLLKYIGLLDAAGKPQASYREFMDRTKAKTVLAARLRDAYDDLFISDKDAHTRGAEKLKGWFKTKTGVGDAVAKKIATTFKALASYADFSTIPPAKQVITPLVAPDDKGPGPKPQEPRPPLSFETGFGLTYRIEIHLPDTTNVDTYRSIFRALREELLS
jgi:hypothetical protein